MRGAIVVVALALVSATGCSPGTEVVVTIDSDELVAPTDLQKVCITVTNPASGANPIYQSQDLVVCPPGKSSNCYSLPISITLTPGSSHPTDTVRVEVDALAEGASCSDPAAKSRAVTSDASVFTFVSGESQRLDFFLYRSCLSKQCAMTDEACNQIGACEKKAPAGGPGAVADMGTTGRVVAQDTFQRADQSLWGVASDGQRWEGDANTAANFSIQGNRGIIGPADPVDDAVGLLGPTVADAEVRFIESSVVGGWEIVEARLRESDGGDYYAAILDGNVIRIDKRQQGIPTTLARSDQPFVLSDGTRYQIRFQAIGNTLRAKAWIADNQPEPADWQVSVTDDVFISGRAGLAAQDFNTVAIEAFQVIGY